MSSAEKADEFFCAKVRGMVTAVENHCYPKFSSFLDGRQRRLAEEVLRQMHCTRYAYEGGSAYAERKMLGVYPDYMEADALAWPMQVLRFVFHKNYALSHRDVLGSLMALQIKRELLGDIYVTEGLAEIVVQESIAEFIRTNVQKIGRVGVRVETADALTLAAEPKLKALNRYGGIVSIGQCAVAGHRLEPHQGNGIDSCRKGDGELSAGRFAEPASETAGCDFRSRIWEISFG